MNRIFRAVALLGLTSSLSGCGLFDIITVDCTEPQPYESSQEVPPLRVPEGLTAPNTRNALQVPEVTAPPRPKAEGRCLDVPPEFAPAAPTAPAAG